MNKKEYGGYLPLEFPFYQGEYYKESNKFKVLRLNCGRCTFYYAAKLSNLKKIYLPHFTCEETKVPFQELNIEIDYYYLNDRLLPKDINVKDNEYMFWTNYYGNASNKEINFIVNKYKNLIIDNCHAFFSKPIKGVYNCYSTRKFFGVPDGAYLIKDGLKINEKIPKDDSYNNCLHLIKQIDKGIHYGYEDSLKNEKRLCDSFKSMSRFTEIVLESLNYKEILKIRRRNFLLMHKLLNHINEFPINIRSKTHMYYPLLVMNTDLRYKLINEKVYNPYWWEHVLKLVPNSSIEYKLSKYTLMLPIDQRYNKKDIYNIAQIVLRNLKK